MTFKGIKNSSVRKLSKEEQKQIKAKPIFSPKSQFKFFLIFAVLLLCAFCATAQTARIDDHNFIAKSETAPTVYHTTVQVSKKKAVRLLCEQIKSRSSTTIKLSKGDLTTSYKGKTYTVAFEGTEVYTGSKVSEVRKACKLFIEKSL